MYNDEENDNKYNDNDKEYLDENFESSTGNKFLDFYYANKKLVLILGALILFLIILLGISSCSNKSNNKDNPISIAINKETVNVSIDNTIQLASSVSDIPYAQIVWSSKDDTIATVNNQGLVTGVKYGTTVITATYTHTDSKIYTASCTVVVAAGDPNLQITEASFPDGSILLSAGNTFKVPFIVTPSNGFLKDVKYTSSNQSIVSVSEDGILTALRSGTATIGLNVNDGEFTDTMDVIVVSENVLSQVIILPTSLRFKESQIKVSINNPIKLEFEIEPVGVDTSNLIWTSSDNSIVTIANDGTLIGVKQGVSTITVKSLNGIQSMILVTVESPLVEVESISITNGEYCSMTKGETYTIIPNVLPSNATNKSVTYSSSNQSIATVDANGVVTAVGKGDCVITVTTNDQGKKATVNINVTTTSGTTTTTSVGKVTFASDKKAVEATYSDADTKKVDGPLTVTMTYSTNVKKVLYCLEVYGNEKCTPNININSGNSFVISDSGVTVIRYIAYNGSYSKEGTKYVGINGNSSTPIGGTTTPPASGSISLTSTSGAMSDTVAGSTTNPAKGSAIITVTYGNNVSSVKYCTYKYGSTQCTPSTSIVNGGKITISTIGTIAIRYSINNGTAKEKYIKIEESSGTSTDNGTFNVSFSSRIGTILFGEKLIDIQTTYNGSSSNISHFYYCSGKDDGGTGSYCLVDISSETTTPNKLWFFIDYSLPSPTAFETYRVSGSSISKIVGYCNMKYSIVAVSKTGKVSSVIHKQVSC